MGLISTGRAYRTRPLSVAASTGKETLVPTDDACYTKTNTDQDLLPSVLFNEAEMYRSLGELRDLRDKQRAMIIYRHDPQQWKEIPHAPEPLA
jgi:hypothetical protein